MSMVCTNLHLSKILEQFCKDDNEIAKTPMDLNLHLSKYIGVGVS